MPHINLQNRRSVYFFSSAAKSIVQFWEGQLESRAVEPPDSRFYGFIFTQTVHRIRSGGSVDAPGSGAAAQRRSPGCAAPGSGERGVGVPASPGLSRAFLCPWSGSALAPGRAQRPSASSTALACFWRCPCWSRSSGGRRGRAPHFAGPGPVPAAARGPSWPHLPTILKFRTMIPHRRRGASFQRHVRPFRPSPRSARSCACWKLGRTAPACQCAVRPYELGLAPRPEMPEFVIFDLPCRPGITGMATIVFAREESILARVPRDHLCAYIHAVVLPASRRRRRCSCLRLRLLVNTVLRRWDCAAAERFIVTAAIRWNGERILKRARPFPCYGADAHAGADRTAAEQVSAF